MQKKFVRFDLFVQWIHRQLNMRLPNDATIVKEKVKKWSLICHLGWFEFEHKTGMHVVVRDLLRGVVVLDVRSFRECRFEVYLATMLGWMMK